MPLALFALSLSLFAIGTTEFVVVGLLPALAGSLHVSLSIIGLLVTAYAIGIAAGGLIVTALSARMNRKHLLVALMAVFIAGNLVSAAAQDVQLLIATRLITAVAHAVIASVGAALAISLVDESKQARAISAVFGGLTASLVVGVPLCTCIGQHLDWRAAFLAVAVISALALVGDLLFLPNGPGSPGVPLRRQVARLADKQLVLALVVALLGFGTPTSLRSWRTSAASAPAPSACCSSGSAQPPRWATSSPDPSPTAGSALPCWGDWPCSPPRCRR